MPTIGASFRVGASCFRVYHIAGSLQKARKHCVRALDLKSSSNRTSWLHRMGADDVAHVLAKEPTAEIEGSWWPGLAPEILEASGSGW